MFEKNSEKPLGKLSARLMKEHGEQATLVAVDRADELRVCGDEEG
jgi:hypothetical protein